MHHIKFLKIRDILVEKNVDYAEDVLLEIWKIVDWSHIEDPF